MRAVLCDAQAAPFPVPGRQIPPEYVHITNRIGNIVDYDDLYFYFETFRQVVAGGETTTHPSGRPDRNGPGRRGRSQAASRAR